MAVDLRGGLVAVPDRNRLRVPTGRPFNEEARREHHAELPLVHTPTIRQLLGTGRLLEPITNHGTG